MKKILAVSFLILSFAGSAFAAATTLTNNAPTSQAASVRGGSTQALANAAPTPLIKFSTGVAGLVNFAEEAAPDQGKSTGYVIAARHATGSKNFLAVNDKTTIYWKQATKVTTVPAVSLTQAMQTDIDAAVWSAFAFQGAGWTSY